MALFSHRWVSFESDRQTISRFLMEWKPLSTLAPEVEWICVSKFKASKKPLERPGSLMRAWEALCKEKKHRVNRVDVLSLAREHDVMSGKWLIYVSSAKVDHAWSLVVHAVLRGDLSGDAKVSTCHSSTAGTSDDPGKNQRKKLKLCKVKQEVKQEDLKPSEMPSKGHVICVYSPRFDDLDDVFTVRAKLRELGFEKQLSYKPDPFTFCGIYSGIVGIFRRLYTGTVFRRIVNCSHRRRVPRQWARFHCWARWSVQL